MQSRTQIIERYELNSFGHCLNNFGEYVFLFILMFLFSIIYIIFPLFLIGGIGINIYLAIEGEWKIQDYRTASTEKYQILNYLALISFTFDSLILFLAIGWFMIKICIKYNMSDPIKICCLRTFYKKVTNIEVTTRNILNEQNFTSAEEKC